MQEKHRHVPSAGTVTEKAHPPASATDPVCGKAVDPATAKQRAAVAGMTYYFCSVRCRIKFLYDTRRYLPPAPHGAAERPDGTYTCPMHPQIRQAGPGHC